nr:hypothetical protein CFP56_11414 [Quercus suber]
MRNLRPLRSQNSLMFSAMPEALDRTRASWTLSATPLPLRRGHERTQGVCPHPSSSNVIEILTPFGVWVVYR